MTTKEFYFDTENDALSPETSHPAFVNLLTDEFYYDCTDEFSPFGNDDGADILSDLEEWYRETQGEENIIEWLFETIDEAGFDHESEPYAKVLDPDVLEKITTIDAGFVPFMDNSIIGAAFGQFKITGKLNKKLKELALIALKREEIIHADGDDEVFLSRLETMANDLTKI